MYDDFSTVDLGSNPYFGSLNLADNYEGSPPTLGEGDGSDWMDWSLLPDEVKNQFMSKRQFGEEGPYRGMGAYNDSNFSLSNLQNYLTSSGNTLKEFNRGGAGYKGMGQWNRGMFDPSGNPVGNIQTGNYGNDMDELGFGLGSMFLNPLGGIAAGGLAGGIGGSLVKNAVGASMINGGLSGLSTALGSGAEDRNILKAGAVGTLGGAMPNVASYAGVENPFLQQAINGALRNAGQAKLMGGDASEAAAAGAIPGAFSYLADVATPYFQTLDDLPGTIGGNQADASGETSATLGGVMTGDQFASNLQRDSSEADSSGGFQSPELSRFFSSIMPKSPGQFGDLAQGLMGMYAGYRQRRDAKKLASNFGANRGAYEQQLQKDLLRRDARAGRRSDYSGRATELQAKLAQLDSNNMPALSALQAQQQGGLLQMLQSGLRYGGKSGAFGDGYNPNVTTAPATSTMLPSTWAQPQPSNYSLGDLSLGDMPRRRGLLGGG